MLPRELLKKVRQIQIRARKSVTELLAGEFRSVFRGTGIEFDELREYSPGDDIRAIDWNVTARMGRPFIKKFMEERELTVVLVVDISGSMDFGTTDDLKRERAAELSALLALSAARNRDKVGLITFTDKIEQFIPPKKGTRHVLRMIRELLYYKPKGTGTDIGEALRYMNLVIHRKAVVFLISDFFGDSYLHDLRLSAKRHDLVALITRDEREIDIPALGLITFTDPETGECRVLDTSNKNLRRDLAVDIRSGTEWLDHEIKAMGADLIHLGSRDDYVAKLHAFFRRRERAS